MAVNLKAPRRNLIRAAEKRLGYILVTPLLLIVIGLSAIPMAFSVWLFFHNYNPLRPTMTEFVGLGNATLLLQDPRLWVSLRNTIYFVGVAIPIEFVLGLAIALVFNKDLFGGRVLRSLMLVPLMIMPIVVGLTFRMLFEYRVGLINWVLADLLRLGRVHWLDDPTNAMYAVIITDVWHYTPFTMMVLLAGLKALPTEPLEAAKVDGASAWQTFRHVTLPLLRPVILVVLILRLIASFKIFDEIFSLTDGGPGTATEVVGYYVYVLGFRTWDLGYASAVSWVMLSIIAVIAIFLIRRLERQIEESA